MAGKKRGNPQNLRHFSQMDAKTKKEIQSKGGHASTKVRRERKAFKEALLLALETVKENGETIQDIGIESLMIKYMSGDLKAFEIVRDTVGEKPIDRQEVKEVTTDWFIEDTDNGEKA